MAAALMQDDSLWMQPWVPPLFALGFMPEHETDLMRKMKATQSNMIRKYLVIQAVRVLPRVQHFLLPEQLPPLR